MITKKRISGLMKHSVARNATALWVMQIANYAVPLLLLPYLTRHLGIEAFGRVAITLSAIQLAFIVTDYGFSLSATCAISLNRENKEYVDKKISAVFGTKVILCILVTAVFLSVPEIFSRLSGFSAFFAAALLAVWAQAFQPIWLFQGVERMKHVAFYMVVSKVVYAVLVFLLVHSPEDALLVILCWGGAQLLGLVAAIHAVYQNGHAVIMPDFLSIAYELKASAQYFWARLAVSLYTSASTLIVGTSGAAQAAQFSASEQIYKAGQNVTSPINTAMFPYMAKSKDWKLFYKVVAVVGTILLLGCLLLAVFSKGILILVFGSEYADSAPVLLVFLCSVVVNYFAVTFGYSAFSALNKVWVANVSVGFGAALHAIVVLFLFLTDMVSALHIALAVLATESFVMIFRLFFFFALRHIEKLSDKTVMLKKIKGK